MTEREATTPVPTTTESDLPLRERAWFKLFLCTLYSIIFVFGVGGNASVYFIISKRKKLKTVTNLFILNLAVSDFIFSGSIPLELPLILNDYEWPYAPFFCKLYSPVQTIAVSVSIFTLTAVSVIRHRAINLPFKRQVSRNHAKFIMVGIWVSSVLLMIPHFSTLKMKGSSCDEEWSDVSYRKIYTTLLFVFLYLIPLIIVVFAYTKIVKELKRKKNYENAALNKARSEETSKVVALLIKVTVVFALCNLPSQLMWLWMDYGNGDKVFTYFWDLLTTLNILIFANSAANPLLYYILHDNFRNEVVAFLERCKRPHIKNGGVRKGASGRHNVPLCSNETPCIETGESEMLKMDNEKLNSNKAFFERTISIMSETVQESCV